MTKSIETRITDLENRVSVLERGLCINSSSSGDKRCNLSLNEFLQKKGPTTVVDTVVAIAVYYERFGGTDSFSAKDLLGLIRKAKQKKPSNINDLINKNVSKGYFEEEEKVGEDGKKRWYVTQSGAELVDDNFNHNEQNS